MIDAFIAAEAIKHPSTKLANPKNGPWIAVRAFETLRPPSIQPEAEADFRCSSATVRGLGAAISAQTPGDGPKWPLNPELAPIYVIIGFGEAIPA